MKTLIWIKNLLIGRMGFSSSMHVKRFLRRLLIILGVFASYFLSAIIGQWLAVPPGYVTLVWLPAGIGLVAVLLFGYRVWPGIFLGSFLHNFLIGVGFNELLIGGIASAILGGFASIQACLGVKLLKPFSEPQEFLETPKGVLKFLIVSAGISLISAIGGVLTLSSAGMQEWSQFFELFAIWWIGDAVGIITVTPLILSWIKYPILENLSKRIWEVLIFFVLFNFAGYYIFHFSLPRTYLILPFPIWAAFRFGYAGLTTVVALINIWVLWSTVNGNGPFIQASQFDSLLAVKMFVGTINIVFLFLMSALMERSKVKKLLQNYNRDLEEKVVERTKQLHIKLKEVQEMQLRVEHQERLSALGALTAGVAHEIKNPLNFIYNFSDLSVKLVEKIDEDLDPYKSNLDSESKSKIEKKFTTLLENIQKVKEHATKANDVIQRMLMHAREESDLLQPVDVHNLIEVNLRVLYQQKRLQNNSFQVDIQKEFDPNVTTIQIVEQDVNRVILNMIDNAFYSLLKKKEEAGEGYQPVLRISTEKLEEDIKIVIWDNGLGVALENVNRIFIPFFSTKPPGEGTGLGLSISHDIIVVRHKGQIKVRSELGKFAEFTIILHKTLREQGKDDK